MPVDSSNALNPWSNIPRKNTLIFLVAVFFIFATIGIVGDISSLGRQPLPRFILGVAITGIFSVYYASIGIARRGRGKTWFWAMFVPVVVLEFVLMGLLHNWYPDVQPRSGENAETIRMRSRLGMDTLAISLSIALGYAGFVIVFVSESRRHIRVHTEKAFLEGELEAARQVQQVILPGSSENFPGFRIDSVYIPAQQVGGDFFQILPDGNGGILAVIGDVSGKGLPAAMLVSMLVGSLRTAADQTTNPLSVLRTLQDRLVGRTSGGFSTALAAHIAGNGQVTLANAGHLPPYLNGKEIEIPGALPLGISGASEYPTTSFTLPLGSRLTFYTDGVIEARNEHGELFGFDRSRNISTEAAAKIAEDAVRFGQSDDITVVTIERITP